MGMLTTEEAERLVEAQKIVTILLQWKRCNNLSWRLEAKAVAPQTQDVFSLRGNIGRDNHSFVLLYKNHPIRKYTKHLRHKFQGKIFTEPHKHTWDTDYGDKPAYIPNDIDPEASIDDQFISFCAECNIDIRGGYQRRLME